MTKIAGTNMGKIECVTAAIRLTKGMLIDTKSCFDKIRIRSIMIPGQHSGLCTILIHLEG